MEFLFHTNLTITDHAQYEIFCAKVCWYKILKLIEKHDGRYAFRNNSSESSVFAVDKEISKV